MKTIIKYAVIDDYGDEWELGPIWFSAPTLDECFNRAESENFHSASIVAVYEDGTRTKVA